MKRCLVALSMLLLLTNSATACLDVHLLPSTYLHGATRVFRGTAIDVFTFKVVTVYRGDDAPGDEAIALIHTMACGQPEVLTGQDYLVVEWPGRQYAHARPIGSSDEEIAFLEAKAPPTTRDQLIETLRAWRDGRFSRADARKWLQAAQLRDVDDWGDDNTSLAHEVINKFALWLAAPTPPGALRCSPEMMVASRVDRGVLLLHLPVEQTDLAFDALYQLQDELVCPERGEDDAP